MHSERNAGAFLDHAEGVGPLMPKARQLLELRRAVSRLLPGNLSRSCVVANVRQGKVVIFAESAAMAAKLRLVAPALHKQLFEAGHDVNSVVVEVQPPAGPAARGQAPRPLSEGAAARLGDLASRLPDSALKSVLLAIAGRAPKKPGNVG